MNAASGIALMAMLHSPLAANGHAVDTIVVTAERVRTLTQESATGSRLGLSLMETPATVTVTTGNDLRARGDQAIVEGVSRSTGVTNGGNPGNAGLSFAMRGFNGQGSVLQLYDGVRLFPNNGSISFPSDPWNVERIEVLSGPASVLFGQGAMGGVVNVIPRSPNTEHMEFDAEAGYGSQNSWRLAAGIGGPISRTLSFRGDVSYRESDGFVDRGESDNLAVSGALRFAPSDTFTLTLRNDFGNANPSIYFGTPLINGALDTSIRHENYNVGDATMRYRDNRLALTAEWDVSDAVSLANTAYWLTSNRKWRNLETYCWIADDGNCPNGVGFGTPGNIYRADNYGIIHDVNQYGSQGHVRFSHDLGGMANSLLIGADVSRVTLNYSHQFASTYQEDEVPVTGFDPGLFIDTVGLLPRYRTRTTSWAIFAEDRLAITDQISLIGGLRHKENKVGRWNWVYDGTGTQIIGETPALNGGLDAFKKLSSTTWRVGAVYQPSKVLSFYAQYATAVDPLGTLTTFATTADQFQLTYANGYQYEVGMKGLFLGGHGNFTLAAYRLVKQNLFTQEVTGGAIEQVGQRSSQGIEASIAFDLVGGFGVSANGTVLDANFDEFAGFEGKTPSGVPQSSANLELRWTDGGRFTTGANLRYVGHRFTDNGNKFRVPAYAVVDLGASYAFTPNLAVDVRVYNLFDKDYAFGTYANEQWILGRPQSFDASVRASF
ncbi:MAG: TonB-dependent siderophore receptor [Alphaproteobacteria bacterium]|nr:TonB-dependent siderophore receptor [Alphaproteobacteria bacterium]MBU0794164.1 TonB-dependent siderophore receptor [Alphaproteobacteria bacterium]MBU0876693.1 TonB-dependent siderophore receptor [Alphaproteobacteria bacterium]MBU1769395.1 TonB-dependent siderophore receptor [Alphaproteobacteria bacterium]